MSHPRPVVMCPEKDIGTPRQIIRIKRGGKGQTSGAGASGWKMRPSAVLARSMSEMARKYNTRGKR